MKKRFSDEQTIGFLREAEAGVSVKNLYRKHGFSDASLYTYRHDLKGVPVPFPVFWLEVLGSDDLYTHEDVLLDGPKKLGAQQVITYSKTFVGRFGRANTLVKPYFVESPVGLMSSDQPVEGHAEKLRQLRKLYEQEGVLDSERGKANSEDQAVPPSPNANLDEKTANERRKWILERIAKRSREAKG